MDMHGKIAAIRHGLPRRRGMRLLLGAAGAAAIASTAIGGSLATAATHAPHPVAAVPQADIVGKGLVRCTQATGEVGFSPAAQAGGSGPLTVSIWFQASRCVGGKPTPKTVIGSMSFQTSNACPLPSGPALGKGTLNLTYNYPPVPNPMIDPSVALVTVNQVGPFWRLTGQVIAGSYPDPVPNLQILLRPVVIGAQNCKTGITSEYIASTGGPGLVNI